MTRRDAFWLMLGALAYPLGVILGDVLAGRAALAPPSDTN